MEPNPILFRDLTYIFVAAVLGGLVAWRLRLPLIIGFVLGGIAISPFTPGRIFPIYTPSNCWPRSVWCYSCSRLESSSPSRT